MGVRQGYAASPFNGTSAVAYAASAFNAVSAADTALAAAVDIESLAIASADVPLSAVAATANDSIPLTAVADGYDQHLLAAGDYVPAADDAELLDGSATGDRTVIEHFTDWTVIEHFTDRKWRPASSVSLHQPTPNKCSPPTSLNLDFCLQHPTFAHSELLKTRCDAMADARRLTTNKLLVFKELKEEIFVLCVH